MSTGVVMLDGPYRGSSVDLGLYKSVFLVAGGSGIAFALGLLDNIIGRCVKLGRSQGGRTRIIEFTWCIGSFDRIVHPNATDIATAASNNPIDLHISIFVICLCDPEAVPHIPNSIITLLRLSIQDLLKDSISLPSSSEKEDLIEIRCDESQKMMGLGGGVAVCASGSEPRELDKRCENGFDDGYMTSYTGVFQELTFWFAVINLMRFLTLDCW
ncbi:uncharacterized protein F5891DRAFT_1258322 [Suillus fuscotomentosus]|uniref:Ferric reductase NAD binding domain-containing protein n=1 Tax=Suillus fuscotomentosus TaxID=1912939 RepID=A0AAD4DW61_9AGAM|nr:uncharacterized protein F5891DRAFT_1258322 [Suillus fuscotomentosus]KAG1893718.1 hypothetical protein F5891DRAFT_1258322 [Suillus fuscotomentosus]